LKQVKTRAGAHPIYLRYPVLIPNEKLRDNIVLALSKKGLGATTSFPASIVDIEQLKDTFAADGDNVVGGRIVAREIVTLPTHPYVTRRDQVAIISLLQDMMS
jgi:dTDP-4-amino-4,6-dideoxygalactose transaminase